MLKFTQLSKICALLIGLLFGATAYAQVGIGTTTPDARSILDISSTNKGFLVPRVNIISLTTIAPITGGATTQPLLVWNTNTTTGIGFYYWNGSNRWIPLTSGVTTNTNWALAGNAIVAANFLGTTNAFDLNIRTSNAQRMRVQANGWTTVGFGATPANTGDQFSALAVGTGTGVSGYSGGRGNGVYGQNVGGGNAVYGINNSSGNAVYGLSLGAGASGDAVHAEQEGSGDAVNAVNYGTGVGVHAENFFFTRPSLYAVDGSVSIHARHNYGGTAILAQSTTGDAIVVDTNDPVSNSIWARNANIGGTAIIGGVANLSVYPPNGTGVAGSGRRLGIFGYAGDGYATNANRGNAAGQFTLDSDRNPATNGTNNGTRASAILAGFDNLTPNGVFANQNSYFGGYFVGGNLDPITGTPSYAYAGIKYGANVNGVLGTNYKIIGNGSNSTIIKDKSNTPRILFSPEAPEILFEDYGTGILVNGMAQIKIDPILKDAIYVDDKHPLKVFIQLEGECNGVFVTNKSADGFTVKELAGGTSNISFSYHLVANRADEIGANGEIASKHVGLRFPVGPGPLKQPELAVRKDGDNEQVKDISSKKRISKVKESSNDEKQPTEEELAVIAKKLEVSSQ